MTSRLRLTSRGRQMLVALVLGFGTIWIVVGLAIQANYGLADASTADAEAPTFAIRVVGWVPVAAVLLFAGAVGAAGLRQRRVRAICAGALTVVWVIGVVVLRVSTGGV